MILTNQFGGRPLSRHRSILADQRGHAAILFGLVVVPILALGGGAVDFSHRADVRMEMQSAADSAALAAARVMQSGGVATEEEEAALRASAEAAARHLFNATLANAGVRSETAPDIRFTDTGVVVSADIAVETSFLPVLGIDELQASVSAAVHLPPEVQVEIALVLDYSGSMQDNDKYVRMTDAAVTFIERIAEDRGDRTRIGIVPFSEYVYATLRGSDIRGTGAAGANDVMTACILNRGYPYSTTDEAPFPAVSASRWPQGDSDDCEDYEDGNAQLRDLTNEFSALVGALEGMRPMGLTNIALAAEMGFHLLSPERPFDAARAYSEENLEKVMILLTDGMQTVPAMGPSGEVSTQAADETTAEVCNNAEAAGIRVFTIAYDIEEQRVHDLLAGCASAGGFLDARDPDAVAGAFEEIYAQLTASIWLSR
jgi:Flp pilus assembly protein TadG